VSTTYVKSFQEVEGPFALRARGCEPLRGHQVVLRRSLDYRCDNVYHESIEGASGAG